MVKVVPGLVKAPRWHESFTASSHLGYQEPGDAPLGLTGGSKRSLAAMTAGYQNTIVGLGGACPARPLEIDGSWVPATRTSGREATDS